MYVLKHNGTEQYRGDSYNDCLDKLHRLQGQSWDYAMRYGGWTITEEKGDQNHVYRLGSN